MTKADLFDTEPVVIDEKIYMKLRFSKVARYSPKELFTMNVELPKYMEFLNNVLGNEGEKGWKYESDSIEVATAKTTARLICGDHYITLRLNGIYSLVKREAEKLYMLGILNI